MPAVARPLSAFLAALLTVGGVLLAAVAPAPAAPVQESGTTEPPRAEDDEDGGDGGPLELVEQTPWVGVDGIFAVTLTTGDVPDDSILELAVYPNLTSRHAFNRSLEGNQPAGGSSVPFSLPLAQIETNENGERTVGFSTGSDGARLGGEPGVYPVALRLLDPAGNLQGELLTYLLMLPAQTPAFTPLAVTVIVEVGAPPAQKPDGTIHFEGDQLETIRNRADLLAEVDIPVSVAPVPETLDALALMEEQEAGPNGRLLTSLGVSLRAHEVLARPYVDVDLEAWSNADLVTEAPGEAEAGAEVLRSRLGIEPVPGIWLTGPTVGTTEAQTWQELGVSHAVLPSDAVTGLSGPATSIKPPGQLPGGLPAFVSDDVLVERLLAVEGTLDAQRFLAELAMIWHEYPARERAVVLRIPEHVSFDADQVAQVLNHLDHGLAVRPAAASELIHHLNGEGGTGSAEGGTGTVDLPLVELEAKEHGDDLGWMPEQINVAKQTLQGLAGTLEDDQNSDRMSSYERALLIAPASRIDPSDRRAYLNYVTQSASEVADAVRAPQAFRITLTARDGTIPLTITNDLDTDVSIRVHLDSNQLEFPNGEEFDLTVPPGGERVDLRVRTRTSGGFPLRVTLTSPDDNVVLDETTFDIRSTAISGVGIVLSLGAGLFLVVWWTRHWLQSRRQRLDTPAS